MAISKKDIMDYVLNSPENTNPAVLSQLLDRFSAESGSEAVEEAFEEAFALEDGQTYAAAADVTVSGEGKVGFVYANGEVTPVVGE